jgi:hypothetical protein
VPLGLEIQDFGNLPLDVPDTFSLDLASVLVNGKPPEGPAEAVQDEFAPAQFRTLSDDEKLAAPSFELHTSGFQVRYGVDLSASQQRQVFYDQVVVDPASGRSTQSLPMTPDTFAAGSETASAARSPLLGSGRAKYRAPDRTTPVSQTRYAVASSDDLTAQPGTEGTFTQAQDALRSYLDQHPRERGRWQVVRGHEVAA